MRRVQAALGDRELDSLTRADLLTYALAQKTAGRSNSTTNRDIALLQRAYRLADTKWPGSRWQKLKEPPPRQGFFEPAEFARVLAEMPEHYRLPLRFAYLTGWRIVSEVLALQWEQVDFLKEEVYLLAGTTKSGEPRAFPLFPQLRAVLDEALRCDPRQRGRYVFHDNGRPIREITHETWNRACARAGVPGRLMHDFRRTAARHLYRATKDEQVSMRLLGHKTPAIFRRYRITDERDLKEAGAALSRLLTDQA